MKNIVTIDFDIIMGPSIEGYNDLISPPYTTMETLETKFPYFGMAKADLYVYEYLTRYLADIVMHMENKDDIKFITTHDQIYNIVKDEKPFNLINIDHHHDINYHNNWDEPILQIQTGNWVKRLFDMKKIEHYLWVGNPNSIMFDEKECPYTDKIVVDQIQKYDLADLAGKTDELIICYSPEYIPLQYRPLFMVWRAVAEEIKETDYLID